MYFFAEKNIYIYMVLEVCVWTVMWYDVYTEVNPKHSQKNLSVCVKELQSIDAITSFDR